MANLGAIVSNARRPRVLAYLRHIWGDDQYPTTNAIVFTSSVLGSLAVLTRNGIALQRCTCDPTTGVGTFTNFDNSGTQPYSINTYTQSGGPTGEGWRADVVGATVTVVKTAEAVRSYGSVSSG